MKKFLSVFVLIILICLISLLYMSYNNKKKNKNIYGQYTVLTQLSDKHYDCDAIKLSDGKILILGNDPYSIPTELYDYNTNEVSVFSFPPSIKINKQGIALPNNKILLIGVCNNQNKKCTGNFGYNDIAVFDLDSNKVQHFYKINDSDYIKVYDYLLMDNGNVFLLLAYTKDYKEHFYKIGIYNPNKNTLELSKKYKMNTSNCIPSGIQINSNEILILANKSKIFKYDINQRVLNETEFTNPLDNSLYTKLGDKILILGSSSDSIVQNDYNLLYDIKEDKIMQIPPMVVFKTFLTFYTSKYIPEFSVTNTNQYRALITGGRGRSEWHSIGGMILNSAEIYDSEINEFIRINDMNCPRYGHRSLLMDDGNILLIGGITIPNKKCKNNSIEVLKLN